MAFPNVIGTPTSFSDAVGSSAPAVTLPSGMTVGNKLFILFIAGGSTTITDPSGYTLLAGPNATPASYDTVKIYGRDIDGSEGSTVTINLSASRQSTAISWEISGGRSGFTSSEIAISALSEQGNVTTADPPSLTPSWGAEDTLWVAMGTRNDGNSLFSSYATNYTLGQQNVQTDSGAGNALSTCMRQLNAATEDPGVLTWNNTKFTIGVTLAIRPAAAAGFPFGISSLPDATSRPPLYRRLRTFIDGFRLPLLNQDTMYVPTYDWPLPRVAPRPNTGFVWSFGPVTVQPPQPPFPTSWPLPLRTQWRDRTWINTFGPQTVSGNQPLNVYSYPLPQVARRNNAAWLNTFIPIAPIVMPPGQSMMRVPQQRAPFFARLRIHVIIPPVPTGTRPRTFVQIIG